MPPPFFTDSGVDRSPGLPGLPPGALPDPVSGTGRGWTSSALRSFLRDWSVPLAACLWLAGVMVLRWPVFREPGFSSDSPIDAAFFAYAGELVRQGGTPYLSFWDHKAPLIFLVNAAGLALSGGQPWGLWLLNLALFSAANVLGYAAMKRAFGATAALFGTVCFALPVAAMLPLGMTEGYVIPLQWAAVLLLVRWDAARPTRFLPALALGVLGALAFYLRANLAGAAVAVGLTLLLVMRGERPARDRAVLVAAGLAGLALVTAALVGYLASRGALAAFWDQAFHYNVLYARSELRTKAGALHFGTTVATQYGSAAILFTAWVLGVLRLRSAGRRSANPALLLAVLWLPIELLLASTSGRHYGHYYATTFAPAGLLAAAFVVELAALVPAAPARRLLVGLLAAGAALSAVAGTAMRLAIDVNEKARRQQVAITADYVRSHTAAADRLFVWGHAADVHFLSGRPPASRFLYPLGLLTPRYADAALVDGLVDELRRAAPPLIVDATPNAIEGENLVPPLAQFDPAWYYPKNARPGRRYWSMTPELRAFYDYVHGHYVPVATVGPQQWVVYQRLPEPAPR
ncbi:MULTISPECIES: glycosyltransferase family 39 protein [Ramlibacter]|uniref:Glycosyltransferase RgtA/B/C/D-like domain-containing protein n=1 Tax=Ramlibacter pinisoli TaxID=2682844 RepID=A0A6N8J168_9BURK|nr:MULTISPECIES: glycosyltransferase family 39 protein [Ramlibacter]MBA2962643.1 glycosyltransferase family 39 protein [Ramlibacter sp. CGMCC 1.13660]MVQ32585.1 hypothetical protein [Ramlibacter pinisoli]